VPVTRVNAFLYDYRQDQMIGLGEPTEHSEAYAINENSVVVGAVGFASNHKKAFVGGRGFINFFSAPSGPIDSSVAKDINDADVIVGYAYEISSYGSIERAFLLTPIEGVTINASLINLTRVQHSMASTVPEPGTMALLLGGGVSLALLALLRHKRRR